MTTDRELADRVEEWLHERELQYATIKLMADVIYALRRSQPEGMVMVPREPTAKMLEAGAMEAVGDSFLIHDERQLERIWSEMLAAAAVEGRKP